MVKDSHNFFLMRKTLLDLAVQLPNDENTLKILFANELNLL